MLTLPATVSLLWIQAFIECYSQAQSLQLPALLSNLETQAMNFAVKEWYHRIFALPPRDLPTHASRRGYHCPHHRLPLRLHRNPSVWPQAPSPLRMSRPSSFYFSPQREKFLFLYACPSSFVLPSLSPFYRLLCSLLPSMKLWLHIWSRVVVRPRNCWFFNCVQVAVSIQRAAFSAAHPPIGPARLSAAALLASWIPSCLPRRGEADGSGGKSRFDVLIRLPGAATGAAALVASYPLDFYFSAAT